MRGEYTRGRFFSISFDFGKSYSVGESTDKGRRPVMTGIGSASRAVRLVDLLHEWDVDEEHWANAYRPWESNRTDTVRETDRDGPCKDLGRVVRDEKAFWIVRQGNRQRRIAKQPRDHHPGARHTVPCPNCRDYSGPAADVQPAPHTKGHARE